MENIIPIQKSIPMDKILKVSENVDSFISDFGGTLSPFIMKNIQKEQSARKVEQTYFQQQLKLKTLKESGAITKGQFRSSQMRLRVLKYWNKVAKNKTMEKLVAGLKGLAKKGSNIFFDILKMLMLMSIFPGLSDMVFDMIDMIVQFGVKLLIKYLPKMAKELKRVILEVLPEFISKLGNGILDAFNVPEDSPLRKIIEFMSSNAPALFAIWGFLSVLVKFAPTILVLIKVFSFIGTVIGWLWTVIGWIFTVVKFILIVAKVIFTIFTISFTAGLMVVGAILLVVAVVVLLGMLIWKFRKQIWEGIKWIGKFIWDNLKIIGIIIVAVLLLPFTIIIGLGILIWKFRDQIWGVIKSIGGAIGSLFSWLWEKAKGFFNGLIFVMFYPFNLLWNFFTKSLPDAFTNMINGIRARIEFFKKIIPIIFAIIVHKIQKVVFGIVRFFIKAFRTINNKVKKFMGAILDFLLSPFKKLIKYIKSVFSNIGDTISFEGIKKSLIKSIKNLPSNLLSAFGSLGSAIKKKIDELTPLFMSMFYRIQARLSAFTEVGGAGASRVAYMANLGTSIANIDYLDQDQVEKYIRGDIGLEKVANRTDESDKVLQELRKIKKGITDTTDYSIIADRLEKALTKPTQPPTSTKVVRTDTKNKSRN